MTKIVFVFLIVWGLTAAGIEAFRLLNKKEKLGAVKTLVYSGLTAAIAVIIITVLVMLF